MAIHRPTLAHAFLALTALAASAASCAAGAPVAPVPGVRSGIVVVAPDRQGLAERVTFDRATGDRLAALPSEESLLVADWPVAPGQRATVELTRHDVYAPDAHVYRVDGESLTELPRSSLVFAWGRVEGDPGARVVAWVDPETGAIEGFSQGRFGSHEIRHDPRSAAREALVGEPRSIAGVPLTYGCAAEGPDFDAAAAAQGSEERAVSEPPAPSALAAPQAATAAGYQMIVAFDTDNEFMSLKFANDTTAATNYVAALVAVTTPIYERDLGIKIVQGTLILRPSTTADPYAVNPGGNASLAELQEFGNYWSANYGSVNRGLAQLLSGKQTNSNSASGIGWIGGLCSSTNGYSVAQVFKFAQQTASNDVLISAHEMGHNFGSPHTHCPWDASTPPIDHCFSSAESYNGMACYSGATSCPSPATYQGVPNVSGTLMSYCHLLGGCGASLVFHPTTIAKLAPRIASAKTAGCITPLSVPQTATRLYTVVPCRVLDTRNATGVLGGPALAGGGALRTFTVIGSCGIPAGAKAITGNVTVTGASAAGDLRIVAGDVAPTVSTVINFPAARTRANNARIQLATNGTGTIAVASDGGAVHFILDVSGYFQ